MKSKRLLSVLISLMMTLTMMTGLACTSASAAETSPIMASPAESVCQDAPEEANVTAFAVPYSVEELCRLARRHYTERYGDMRMIVECDHIEGNEVVIHIYDIVIDHTVTFNWYYINQYTGRGTDFFGDPVDLSVYGKNPLDLYCPFYDVPYGSWFYDYVRYNYMNGLMNGTGEFQFEPQLGLSRAMFVTILGRLAGVDTKYYSGSRFSDVPTGQWYSGYVEWARRNNITQGMGDGRFGVNDLVTREQMSTFIVRYVQSKGVSLPKSSNSTSQFKDRNDISSYARDGVELMRYSGIIKGNENGYFMPKSAATRAEAATIFMRLREALK